MSPAMQTPRISLGGRVRPCHKGPNASLERGSDTSGSLSEGLGETLAAARKVLRCCFTGSRLRSPQDADRFQ